MSKWTIGIIENKKRDHIYKCFGKGMHNLNRILLILLEKWSRIGRTLCDIQRLRVYTMARIPDTKLNSHCSYSLCHGKHITVRIRHWCKLHNLTRSWVLGNYSYTNKRNVASLVFCCGIQLGLLDTARISRQQQVALIIYSALRNQYYKRQNNQ